MFLLLFAEILHAKSDGLNSIDVKTLNIRDYVFSNFILKIKLSNEWNMVELFY